MRNYVFLFFLPGSAGNFFSRCLALAGDEYYSWVSPNLTPHLTVDQKWELYRYQGLTDRFDDWIEFEKTLVKHANVIDHDQLPDNSVSIWLQHPDLAVLAKNIPGPDDRQLTIYIDPSREFEWVTLNALWKHSQIDVKWLKNGMALLEDPAVHKVPVEAIIRSPSTLLAEIESIVDKLGKTMDDHSRYLISALWHEWQHTTLKPERFSSFKKEIGFLL